MAAISVTAANVLASSAAVIRREYAAGATVTAGQLVYLNASNAWALVDIDANLGCGVADLRGITLNGASTGQPVAVCTNDTAFVPGGTLSNGLVVFGSVTAGGITFADIPGANAYPVVVGIAKSATVLNLQPFASGAII